MPEEAGRITVICACGKKYRVGAEKIGKKFACKDCGATIRVTAATGDLEETFPEDGAPPKKAPRKGARHRKPKTEDRKDRRREAKKASPAALVVVLVLGLAAGAGAGIAAIAFLGGASAEEK